MNELNIKSNNVFKEWLMFKDKMWKKQYTFNILVPLILFGAGMFYEKYLIVLNVIGFISGMLFLVIPSILQSELNGQNSDKNAFDKAFGFIFFVTIAGSLGLSIYNQISGINPFQAHGK